MKISEILAPGSVKVIAGCGSKKRLFRSLGEMAADAHGLESSKVLAALMEREELGPTAVGEGVALPHARLHGLTEVRGLFVRLDKPLEFKAADRRPVDLIFTLLAPLDAGVAHLKALASVSRLMRSTDIREKLRANDDPATLLAILTEDIAQAA